ncbi:MAG: S9 family peptidase [Pseudomonadota bacterium]
MKTLQIIRQLTLPLALVTVVTSPSSVTAAPRAELALHESVSDPMLASSPPSDLPLTIERLFSDPDLNGAVPSLARFSPDGRFVSYLKPKDGDYLTNDLWVYEIAAGEHRVLVDSASFEAVALSEAEKARRERKRIQSSGIVEYSWHPDGTKVLVPLSGDLFLAHIGGDADNGDVRIEQITSNPSFETDARFSPGGGYVSFVRDQNLLIYDLAKNRERAVTTAGAGAISYGVAEFVAQEEMRRYTGYWWSGDDQFIAVTKVDESGVEIIPRYDIGAGGVDVVQQRYPRAGATNAMVELKLFDLQSAKSIDLPLPDGTEYLARVTWHPDNQHLIVQTQPRSQQKLTLTRYDVATGSAAPLWNEDAVHWINLTNDLKPLAEGDGYLWTSERDGFRHIYLMDGGGEVVRQVTDGDWSVKAIERIDEASGQVFFSANRDDPLAEWLYAVSYRDNNAPLKTIVDGADWYGFDFRPAVSNGEVEKALTGQFLASRSRPDQPPQIGLFDQAGDVITWLAENKVEGDHPYVPYAGRAPLREFDTLQNEDGVTLHYELAKPHDFDPNKKYPAILHVYGGPHVQTVQRGWRRLLDQIFTERGYVVFRIDNRGSDNRGVAFETAISRHLGEVEVADQLAGVQFLKARPFVDPARVGVWGWSYGGYMTLMLASKAGEEFAAAVSGAPVTDWTLYDTHYTERYLGHPETNAVGYEKSRVLAHADGISTPLLMIHGMADDNVTFDNSTRLYAFLQERAIPFEMMTYPGQRHGIRGKTRQKHLYETIFRFFDRHLKSAPER